MYMLNSHQLVLSYIQQKKTRDSQASKIRLVTSVGHTIQDEATYVLWGKYLHRRVFLREIQCAYYLIILCGNTGILTDTPPTSHPIKKLLYHQYLHGWKHRQHGRFKTNWWNLYQYIHPIGLKYVPTLLLLSYFGFACGQGQKEQNTGYFINNSINMMLIPCITVLKMKSDVIYWDQETIENFKE